MVARRPLVVETHAPTDPWGSLMSNSQEVLHRSGAGGSGTWREDDGDRIQPYVECVRERRAAAAVDARHGSAEAGRPEKSPLRQRRRRQP